MVGTPVTPAASNLTGTIPIKRLFRHHDTLLARLQLCFSVAATVLLLLGLTYWYLGDVPVRYRELALIAGLLTFITYELMGVFRQARGRVAGALQLTKAWTVVVSVVLLMLFMMKTSASFSRVIIVSWIALDYLVQISVHVLVLSLARRFNLKFGPPLPTLVVGSNWLARHLVHNLNKNTWLPDKVVGVVDNSQKGRDEWDRSMAPWLGSTNEIGDIVQQKNIRRVYIALPLGCSDMVETVYQKLLPKHVDVVWAPDIFALRLLNHSVREMAGVPLLTLSESPLADQGPALAKTVMDYSIATLMLICLSPVMLATAIAIKLTSPGPVFYRQKRHGWDGRIIEVWKFRSMIVHQQEVGTIQLATKDDPRVTPVGRFIRRTSIDELPQLFNVLNGTMSLVGPRPQAIEVNDFYSQHISNLSLRHRLKPGITGLAQVNGWRGGDDCTVETLDKMEPRIAFDIDYINRWSIWLDLKVLIKTPFSLFSKDVY